MNFTLAVIVTGLVLSLCWYIASFFYKNDFQEEGVEETPQEARKEEKHPLEGKLLPIPDRIQKVIDQSVPCSGEFPNHPIVCSSGIHVNFRSSYE